eukprot:366028-Chlamydomonas_euryale.AAC.29
MVPTNDAFDLYFASTETDMEALKTKDNGTFVVDLLSYHIHGKFRTVASLSERKGASFMNMINDLRVFVSKDPGSHMSISDLLGRQASVMSEMEAASNMVMKLDAVLIPVEATNMAELFTMLPGHYSFLMQAMSMFQWSSQLMYSNESSVTMLAPFNDAFVYYALHMELELYTLLANSTVVEGILKAHLHPSSVVTTTDLYEAGSQTMYETDYPDAGFYASYSANNKLMMLMGSGAIQNRWPFVIEGDLVCANSIVHGVDMLLVPEEFFGSYYGDYGLYGQ